MVETIALENLSTQLSDLIHTLGPADEIVLTENAQPIARIVLNVERKQRVPGLLKGYLTIVAEDDDHLEDFKEYMP